MIDLDVSVRVSEGLKRIATQGRKVVVRALEKALRRAGMVVEGRAKQVVYAGHPDHLNAGVGSPGLRGSITTDVAYPYASVGSNIVYAAIHEFGGTIVPKSAPALVFKIGDQWVRTQRVTIPPRPYLVPSLNESADEIVEVFGNTLSHELKLGA